MPAPNRRKEARYDAENLLLYPAKDHSLNSKIAFALTFIKDTSLPEPRVAFLHLGLTGLKSFVHGFFSIIILPFLA